MVLHKQKGRGSANYGQKITKVCPQCGTEYIRRYGLRHRSGFCSRACASKALGPTKKGTHTVETFWALVGPPSGPKKCREWLGYKEPTHGYGRVGFQGRLRAAHRLAYELTHGITLPTSDRSRSSLMILHSCDNPPCCNPDHLRIGTGKDNSADCVLRGRQRNGVYTRPDRVPRGKGHGNAKLSEKDIVLIRRMRDEGEKLRSLASHFKVSESSISVICRGIAWKHI